MAENSSWKRAAKWAAGGVVILILLLPALFFAFLQTSTGKSLAARALSHFLSSEPDRKVSVGKIEGLVPFRMRIGRVSASDSQGPYFDAEDIVLRWSAPALLRGKIYIEQLSTASLHIERLPRGGPPQEGGGVNFSSLVKKLRLVRIERLAVPDLSIGRAVLGQSAVFGLEARVTNRPLKISFHLKRMDEGPKTSADVELTLDGEPPALAVRADFREEEGGLAGKIMGLRPTVINLDVRGSGPVTDWTGTIAGSAGVYGSINATIGVNAASEIFLALNGTAEIAEPFLPPSLAPVMGGGNSFALHLDFAPSRYVAVQQGSFKGKGYHAELSGKLDFKSQTVKSDWILGMENLGAAGSLPGGEVRASGTVSGKLSQPEGSATVLFRRVRTGGFAAEEIRTNVQFEPLRRVAPPSSGYILKGSSRARGISTSTGEVLPESLLTWSLEAQTPAMQKLLLLTLRIENQHNVFNAAGRINTAERSGTLEASLRVVDLKPFEALAGRSLPGAATLDLNLLASGSESSFSGSFNGRAGRLEELPPPLAALLGPAATFSGRFEDDAGKISLSEFRAESPAMQIKGQATANLLNRQWQGKWELLLPRLEPLSSAAGMPLAGSIRVNDSFSGSIDSLEHVAVLKGTDLILDGGKFARITATVAARDVPEAPKGTIKVEMSRDGENLAAESGFALANRQLALSAIGIEVPGGRLKGDIVVDLQKTLARGELEGTFKDLGGLGHMAGEKIEGSAELKFSLAPGKNGQDVRAEINAGGISTSAGSVAKIAVSADLENVFQTPEGSVNLELHQAVRGGLTADLVKAGARADQKGISFDVSGKGRHSEQPFDFRTEGALVRAKEAERLNIKTLDGHYGDRPFRLVGPFLLVRSSGKVSFDRLALSYGNGHIAASGSFDTKKASFNADFEKIGIETPSGMPDITASASGRLRVGGDVSSPSASLDLQVTDIHAKGPFAKEIKFTRLDVGARVAGGDMKLNAELESQTKDSVKATIEAPMTFSLLPMAFSVPPQGHLHGVLEGRADLSTVASLIPQPDHEFTGRADARFELGGTVASPEAGGTVKVADGTYQNLAYGTVMKDLSVEITARGRRLDIDTLRATDGGKGTVSAKGRIDLDAANSFPLHIGVDLSNFELIRRYDATAVVGGSIEVSGSVGKPALQGQLETSSAEVLLQQPPPPSIVDLKVIEIHDGTAPAPAQKNEARAASGVGPALDIRISMPGKILVRGRGLDSEWRGNLRVAGSGGNQAVTGNLSAVRGTFDFLGKRFSVTNGVIRFEGAFPSAATLDVTAEAQANDITARLILQGPVLSPQIRFESDPPLPSDEILARVLFNRSTGNITPIQALRLAEALRALSGRGSALDFLGRTREFLGLGQLELREVGKNEGLGLGIGKYLTEGVYVDVEKGVESQEGKLSATIELTPHITLETEAGLDSSKGIGLLWKRDY